MLKKSSHIRNFQNAKASKPSFAATAVRKTYFIFFPLSRHPCIKNF